MQFTHHVPPPCKEEVKVLFSDDDLVVAIKPAGLLSVPGRFLKDSVLHRLLYEYPDARPVHRLDLDTSGVMVLAQSQRATSDLNRQFRERLVSKTYFARVWGRLKDDAGEIRLPMRADPHNRPRQVIDIEQGKQALTRYFVVNTQTVDRTTDLTLVRLEPVTGRSHQLRLHMAAIGHPILGCDLYAFEKAFNASDRLCLHASSLSFTHPVSQERLEFSSECPF